MCAGAFADDPPALQASSFEVSGATLLDPAQLQAVLAPYRGASSLVQLQAAAQAVQAAYRTAGYGGVVAWLPEQQVSGGVVHLSVREGRIAHIVVIGNQRLSEADVRASLPDLREGETPRVARIDAEVQFANQNPGRQLAVVLEEGEQPGDIEARITVSEQPDQHWTVSADNTGTPSTGTVRMGIDYASLALAGSDQQFQASLQVAPQVLDKVLIGSLNWRIPLYAHALTLSTYAVYSNVGGISTATAAGSTLFSGRGKVVGFNLDHQLERWGEYDQHMYAGIDWRLYGNACTIVGLGPDACGAAGASVAVLPLEVGYTLQREGTVPSGASISVEHNLANSGYGDGPSDFNAARPGASNHFSTVHLAAFGGLATAADWRLLWRLNAQAASGALVAGEQFGLAGVNMVRGFEEREVSGDQGVAGRAEGQGPNLWPQQEGGPVHVLRAAAFLDAGRIWNRGDTPCLSGTESSCSLAALGLGLRGQAAGLQWHLDATRALDAGRNTGRGDARLQFRLAYGW